jgi:hypothetical protein
VLFRQRRQDGSGSQDIADRVELDDQDPVPHTVVIGTALADTAVLLVK